MNYSRPCVTVSRKTLVSVPSGTTYRYSCKRSRWKKLNAFEVFVYVTLLDGKLVRLPSNSQLKVSDIDSDDTYIVEFGSITQSCR